MNKNNFTLTIDELLSEKKKYEEKLKTIEVGIKALQILCPVDHLNPKGEELEQTGYDHNSDYYECKICRKQIKL